MSKAEEKALKEYPQNIVTDYNGSHDLNYYKRVLYQQGYHQAEKDLELSWEDVNSIKLIIEQVECDYVEQEKKLYTKYFYEEVLKRFKAQKGEQ